MLPHVIIAFARLGILGVGFQFIFMCETIPMLLALLWCLQSVHLVTFLWELLMAFKTEKDEEFMSKIYNGFLVISIIMTTGTLVWLFISGISPDPSNWMPWIEILFMFALLALSVLSFFEKNQTMNVDKRELMVWEIAIAVFAVEHLFLTGFSWASLIWLNVPLHFLSLKFHSVEYRIFQLIVDSIIVTFVLLFKGYGAMERVWAFIITIQLLCVSLVRLSIKKEDRAMLREQDLPITGSMTRIKRY